MVLRRHRHGRVSRREVRWRRLFKPKDSLLVLLLESITNY
jgi:hypothetical protein